MQHLHKIKTKITNFQQPIPPTIFSIDTIFHFHKENYLKSFFSNIKRTFSRVQHIQKAQFPYFDRTKFSHLKSENFNHKSNAHRLPPPPYPSTINARYKTTHTPKYIYIYERVYFRFGGVIHGSVGGPPTRGRRRTRPTVSYRQPYTPLRFRNIASKLHTFPRFSYTEIKN